MDRIPKLLSRSAAAAMALLYLTLLCAQDSQSLSNAQEWIDRGVQAYKSARYVDAVADFQKAAGLNPTDPVARLYLGTTFMTQYAPGRQSRENIDLAKKARAEFERVLQL